MKKYCLYRYFRYAMKLPTSKVIQKRLYDVVWYWWLDRVFHGLQAGIVPFSLFFWPKFSKGKYYLKQGFYEVSASLLILIASKVIPKWLYNEVWYWGFDRVFHGLHAGIVCFSLFFWPKIFNGKYYQKQWLYEVQVSLLIEKCF